MSPIPIRHRSEVSLISPTSIRFAARNYQVKFELLFIFTYLFKSRRTDNKMILQLYAIVKRSKSNHAVVNGNYNLKIPVLGHCQYQDFEKSPKLQDFCQYFDWCVSDILYSYLINFKYSMSSCISVIICQ